MKVILAAVTAMAFCVGCGRMGRVNHTMFFRAHDAKAHLESVAKTKGYDVGGGGYGHSVGGSTGEKSFQISIKGDGSNRDALMQEYRNFVEKELTTSGVIIKGRGISGLVHGFDFNYHGPGVTGIIRVNSYLDLNGYIQVDVFLYEHK